MKSKILQLAIAVGVLFNLAGCSEEKVPEPTAENCAKGTYEKNLSSLSKEANRNEFIDGCRSFNAAQEMTEWKFEKSPESKY
ncbi:entry exclusion lipoprotein TrbK [Pseudomonas kermanshahensis]|uniref:entry exclusion lipoprotein TrbK n=1 Tax=Pseudomonas kermanshahensis TaxID=2745482 RepID=UPI0023DBA628|nr:entry exclusion lipoprotein TrbK [Pseudomonas kermanshahensis]WEL55653.1 entry exclusion lipoprotein TrbK [Pseudomonas kermanshahensis]